MNLEDNDAIVIFKNYCSFFLKYQKKKKRKKKRKDDQNSNKNGPTICYHLSPFVTLVHRALHGIEKFMFSRVREYE